MGFLRILGNSARILGVSRGFSGFLRVSPRTVRGFWSVKPFGAKYDLGALRIHLARPDASSLVSQIGPA